jgi:tRNA-specific 2-thiouridylase
VKFGVLPEVLKSSGISFDFFATGHYANVDRDPGLGRYLLKKAKDSKKDQTYFLYRLSQEQLSRIMFPLGIYTKDEVRTIARTANLPVHDKKESQDFYSGNLEDLLQKENIPGDIVMTNGKVMGKHRGIWHYTIGQRKGLGVSYSEPLYVVEIDAVHNRIVLGTEKETCSDSCSVNLCNWIAIENLLAPLDVQVKIRSTSNPVPATIAPAASGSINVNFSIPASAITPGQSAVFYDGEKVVGGGIIV